MEKYQIYTVLASMAVSMGITYVGMRNQKWLVTLAGFGVFCIATGLIIAWS